MSKCPSFFGKCDPNAKYDDDDDDDDDYNMFVECLQQCTPKPCSSNLNNILSNCTPYLNNKNLMSKQVDRGVVIDMCGDLFVPSAGRDNPGINPLNTKLDNLPPGIFVNDAADVCKASYTGTNSPIFQKNVDYACKNNTSYPITSTLYPKCSSYLNNLWTKCSNITHTPIPAICDDMFDDSGVTLPPQVSKPPTYCTDVATVAFDDSGDASWAFVNQETGEYVGNIIACGGSKHPLDDDNASICLAQYNDPPSKAFCNEFESSPSPKKGLSTGAIVGIIIGSLVLLLIIGVVSKRKRSR